MELKHLLLFLVHTWLQPGKKREKLGTAFGWFFSLVPIPTHLVESQV
jgi:hypothetical protein